jgi:hypothetical protein
VLLLLNIIRATSDVKDRSLDNFKRSWEQLLTISRGLQLLVMTYFLYFIYPLDMMVLNIFHKIVNVLIEEVELSRRDITSLCLWSNSLKIVWLYVILVVLQSSILLGNALKIEWCCLSLLSWKGVQSITPQETHPTLMEAQPVREEFGTRGARTKATLWVYSIHCSSAFRRNGPRMREYVLWFRMDGNGILGNMAAPAYSRFCSGTG